MSNRLQLRFLGATGTVTGSKFLLETGRKNILIDCGLFQGYKQLRRRNWDPLPVHPAEIDCVVLTHAHLDHSGYLPLLARNGFTGPVWCTAATRDLCRYLLPDSGFIHEKDAEFANRHGFSKHRPAKPLYTRADAERCLELFKPVDFDQSYPLLDQVQCTFTRAGHILGAASLQFIVDDIRIVFSGDLGHAQSATMMPPAPIPPADFVIVESTYGDRKRIQTDPEPALAGVVNETVGRGGTVIIPAFAVGRTQSVLYHLHRLMQDGRIPRVPVYLDSPLAISATEVFTDHPNDHRLSRAEAEMACALPEYVRDVERSKGLCQDLTPKIVIAGSGMATGGRVLHHLKVYVPDARNTVLFTGFQAGGTRGAAMLQGVEKIKIHGQHWPVRAHVQQLDMLSAHADCDEITDWLASAEQAPSETFIVHGEPEAADGLRKHIEERLGWSCQVPHYQQVVDLNGRTDSSQP